MRRLLLILSPILPLSAEVAHAQPAPAEPPVVAAPAPPAVPAAPAAGAPAPVVAAPLAPAAPVTPAAPTAPPVVATTSTVPVAEASSNPEAPAPTKLAVGKLGFFQPAAQLQFWAYGQSTELDGEQNLTSGFRLRRAELRVRGEIVPKLFSYNVMIDPSRALEFENRKLTVAAAEAGGESPGTVTVAHPSGPTSVLQDVILTFITDYADVSVGQFKLPIGYEAYNSTAKLVMPEFALITRHYSARRDIGVKVDKKLGKHFYYRLDLLNGSGQNRLENDDQKDGALRLEAYPFEGLTLAAVGYLGLNQRNSSATKDRVEADLKLDYRKLLVQAEYIHGWDGATGDSDPERVEGHGFYAALGYTIAEKLQPLVRVGYVDPHLGAEVATHTPANDRVWSYEAGANYFVQGHELELQLALGVFDYEHLASVHQGIFEVQVNF